MNSRITASALAVVLVTAGTAVIESAPAWASNGCAKKADYRKVHKGQTLAKVARELHSNGHKQGGAHSGGYRDQIRSYKACSQYSYISIGFSADPGGPFRENAKDAVWSD